MLFTAGTLNSYIQNQALQWKTNQRLNNINMEKGLNANSGGQLVADSMQQARKQQEREAIGARTELITMKLKSGAEISGKDLDFLRDNAPELYTKALRVIQERKAYEESLKRCRTKEEVERVKASRVQQFAAEAQSIQQANMPLDDKLEAMENLQWRLSAVTNQHGKFIKSKEYAKLPTEEERRRKKEEKEKESGSVRQDSVEIRDYRWEQQNREALDALKKHDWQDTAASGPEEQHGAAESGAGSAQSGTDAAAAEKADGAAFSPAPSPVPAADTVPAPGTSAEVRTTRLPAGVRA